MQGWPIVFAIAVLEVAVAAVMVRYAARRWMDYFIILAAALVLLEPIAGTYGGDVSRYLPEAVFSPGPEGKDQIILASAATAVFSAPALAAAGLMVIQWLWRISSRRPASPR
jgi:hypothetical protein